MTTQQHTEPTVQVAFVLADAGTYMEIEETTFKVTGGTATAQAVEGVDGSLTIESSIQYVDDLDALIADLQALRGVMAKVQRVCEA